MIRLRPPNSADAVVYFVHANALGDRASLPREQARLKLGLLALLTVLPDEVATEMKRAGGGLAEMGDAYARRSSVFGVPADEINEAAGRASRAVVMLAEAIFFDKFPDPQAPTPTPKAAHAVIAEPEEGAPVEVIQAYHAALAARNAYERALKAG